MHDLGARDLHPVREAPQGAHLAVFARETLVLGVLEAGERGSVVTLKKAEQVACDGAVRVSPARMLVVIHPRDPERFHRLVRRRVDELRDVREVGLGIGCKGLRDDGRDLLGRYSEHLGELRGALGHGIKPAGLLACSLLRRHRDVIAHHAVREHRAVRVDDVTANAEHGVGIRTHQLRLFAELGGAHDLDVDELDEEDPHERHEHDGGEQHATHRVWAGSVHPTRPRMVAGVCQWVAGVGSPPSAGGGGAASGAGATSGAGMPPSSA